MNIFEAFDTGLPELPAKSSRNTFPKLDPAVVSKEHIEHGVPTILAKAPGADSFVNFTPDQWALLKLFDGVRSYDEIAVLIQQQTNVGFTVEDVKEFAAFLQDKTDLFYRTPLEKNIILKQKLGTHRHKHKRVAFSDVTEITLHRWPYADAFLSKVQPYFQFMYTPWFVLLTFVAFAAMVGMWTGKQEEIWYDSFQFYNFAGKSGRDLVEFWFLFGGLALCHESAHGMTCKHFGGRVEKMEFLLMYFSPTFMCDVTELWVVGDRRARLYTVAAGIWVDLIICFFATTIWWATAPGMWIHDFSYKVIMVTGIGVTLLNLNPLIKLDGYYLFSELIGESDLYERSATYVSQWMRKHILRLPVEVEFVPKRRRRLYIVYSLVSTVYGYSLIFFISLLLYHIFRYFSPEYGWIPGWIMGFLMFRSRIRKVVRLMKEVYLDKKDRVSAWFTPMRIAACSVAFLIFLALPIWPVFIEGRFMLEPARRAVIRTQVAGVVTQVLTSENQNVQTGAPLVRLENLRLESEAAQANANFREASARATTASLRYTNLGRAEHEREQAAEKNRILAENMQQLSLTSPIDGTVVTPRLQDAVGSYVPEGTQLVEVADLHTMTARIFIPEFGVRDVRVGTRVRLQLDAHLVPINGQLVSIAPVSAHLDPGLVEKEQLSGIVAPPFYVGKVEIPNDGSFREGMNGTAKLFVHRRSAAAIGARFIRDLVERRFW